MFLHLPPFIPKHELGFSPIPNSSSSSCSYLEMSQFEGSLFGGIRNSAGGHGSNGDNVNNGGVSDGAPLPPKQRGSESGCNFFQWCPNDIDDIDLGAQYACPSLGGSIEYPYPRRGRTGRPPTKSDSNSESRLNFVMSLDIYVPRDEQFIHLKLSYFLANALKSIAQVVKPELESLFDNTPKEFDSFEDVFKLYEGRIKVSESILKNIRDKIPAEMLTETL
ncbi:putative linoleate 9S-lipoxygenase 5 [Glycine soja]